MKRFISLLSVVSLLALGACTDGNDDMNNVYDSVITPDFSISEGEIVAGTTPVTFTNLTTVEGTTIADYFWHFGFSGEGNWSEEAQPDPVVYAQAGEYTVTLTAWGADGNRATVKKIVTVLADNVLPTADFSYAPMMVNVGDEVTFTDKSSDSDGEIVSRKWTFPDGSTSTDESPTYTFSAQGMFRVTLSVTDDRGGENSVTKSVNVREGDVEEFTVLWSKEVAAAEALCAGNVVTVSDLGYIYAVTGEGKLVALDAAGEVAWEYDATAQDKVLLTKEIAYTSVDADGTVYWAAHAYGDKSAAPTVYAFDGSMGSVLWKNQTAYVSEDRIAYSTPCITPEMLVVGNRGTSGMLRRFDKASGRNIATVKPANGGISAGTIVLKSGAAIYTASGTHGYGLMVPDNLSGWAAVSKDNGFTPGDNLSSNQCQPCVGSDNVLYLAGTINGSGTWNLAAFDCTNLTASSSKTPKWSVALDGGFKQTGASLSADGQTLYIVADAVTPSVVYALNTSNGATRWSWTLDAECHSIPAVDNLGQVHVVTASGTYVVLSSEGEVVYSSKIADSFEGSVSIAEWGYAYVLGKDTAAGKLKVYAVALPGVTSAADSSWSQYGGNARHINYQK